MDWITVFLQEFVSYDVDKIKEARSPDYVYDLSLPHFEVFLQFVIEQLECHQLKPFRWMATGNGDAHACGRSYNCAPFVLRALFRGGLDTSLVRKNIAGNIWRGVYLSLTSDISPNDAIGWDQNNAFRSLESPDGMKNLLEKAGAERRVDFKDKALISNGFINFGYRYVETEQLREHVLSVISILNNFYLDNDDDDQKTVCRSDSFESIRDALTCKLRLLGKRYRPTHDGILQGRRLKDADEHVLLTMIDCCKSLYSQELFLGLFEKYPFYETICKQIFLIELNSLEDKIKVGSCCFLVIISFGFFQTNLVTRKMRNVEDDKEGQLIMRFLEPSRVDQAFEISRHCWVVSVLNTDEQWFGLPGHAALVIEGITFESKSEEEKESEVKHFVRVCDIQSQIFQEQDSSWFGNYKGFLSEIRIFKTHRVDYSCSHLSYYADPDKVCKMLQSIELDQEKIQTSLVTKKDYILFQRLGQKNVLSDASCGINCADWVSEKLSIADLDGNTLKSKPKMMTSSSSCVIL